MSRRSLWFLVVALVAGALGFGTSGRLANASYAVCLVSLVVAVLPVVRGRQVPDAWSHVDPGAPSGSRVSSRHDEGLRWPDLEGTV